MNLYSRDDERAIRVQRMVDDWTKSGLLVPEQRERIAPELKVDLRRTNRFLRITLFVFAYLIVNSITGLFVVMLNLSEDAATGLAFGAAAAFFAIAQMLVTRYRLYHFGVEEAAAIASVSFLAIGSAMALTSTFSILQGLIAAALGSFIVFRRFGYLYAGVAAVIFAGAVPFGLAQVDTVHRLLSMVILLVIFFLARERRQDHESDYPGDAYGVLEAVAWAMLYFMADLQISFWFSAPDGVWQFEWATHAAIWILPIAGLALATRERQRAMLDVNIVLALVTVISDKLYRGSPLTPWDPIVVGVLLIVIVIAVRRWLASGPGGSRRGFVAHRLLASEKARLALAANATLLVPGAPSAHSQQPDSTFGGGRSGGAGATGDF